MVVSLVQMRYRGSKDEMVKATTKEIERLAKSGSELIGLQELHQSEYFCQSENTEFRLIGQKEVFSNGIGYLKGFWGQNGFQVEKGLFPSWVFKV